MVDNVTFSSVAITLPINFIQEERQTRKLLQILYCKSKNLEVLLTDFNSTRAIF